MGWVATDKGREGENIAVEYLKKRGYRIIERNFRTRYGEVDIIGYQGRTLVFFEVKMRRFETSYPPEEAVNERKQKKIINVAKEYLSYKTDLPPFDHVRFDVIAVRYGNKEKKIEHYEGAFIDAF